MTTRPLFVLLSMTALACADPEAATEEAAPPDTATEASAVPEELLAADRDFNAAVQERGADAWVEAFAPDGAMVSGALVTRGPADIRGVMIPFFADTTRRLQWEPTSAEVSAGGDLGYTIGEYRVTVSPGDSVVETGRYLTVWRRQADGSWKVEADIGSPAP